MKTLSIFLSFMFFTACGGPRYVDYFPYHDDGRPKSKVVLLPVKVSCGKPESWGKELTVDIRYEIMDQGKLYMYREDEIERVLQAHPVPDYFCRNLDFSRYYGSADYIALVELDADELVYYGSDPRPFAHTVLRLRVIDLRGDCPKICLSEVLEGTERLACPPGKAELPITVYRGSHLIATRKVADRLSQMLER
jgi:hypothetical protein